MPSKKVHEDDEIVAFEDVNPQAPVHILVIPRKHIATLNDLQSADDATLGRIHRVAAELAQDRDLAGYRTVMNCNAEAGQTVFHIHLHLIGGRPMQWPPG